MASSVSNSTYLFGDPLVSQLSGFQGNSTLKYQLPPLLPDQLNVFQIRYGGGNFCAPTISTYDLSNGLIPRTGIDLIFGYSNPITGDGAHGDLLNLLLQRDNVLSSLYSYEDSGDNCNFPYLPTFDDCKVLYGCLYAKLAYEFTPCIHARLGNKTLYCPLSLSYPDYTTKACQLPESITADAWDYADTDVGIQAFLSSGVDVYGIWWQGVVSAVDSTSPSGSSFWPTQKKPFVSEFGRQALGDGSFKCSLQSPCSTKANCGTAGSYSAYGLGTTNQFYPEDWTVLVLLSLQNINQQLNNHYVALHGATIEDTLRTFKSQDFYPQKKSDFGLLNILQGLTSAFAILGGFVPALTGLALEESSAVIGAVGAYLSRYVGSSQTPDETHEEFADILITIYRTLRDGLDLAAEALFNGSTLDGNFTIVDMMRGGKWVDNSVIQDISILETQTAIEILSRAINQLWKTPSSNKIFVLYVDLHDTVNSTANCRADSSGPPALKYCADGGVYYAYNFIEKGEKVGYLGWPWGGDKLKEIGIDPAWVTEASARSYRLAKATPGLNPFNLTQVNATTAYIDRAYGPGQIIDPNNVGGRLPGSWTLPVCNASTWGTDWNWNFIDHGDEYTEITMPCFCGQDGSETKDWAFAAGMRGFQTYYETCQNLLTSPEFKFQWPPGVTSVDLGFGDAIKKPQEAKPVEQQPTTGEDGN